MKHGEKWFIPPRNKPVEVRIIEPADPPFPHVQFVRGQLDPFGLYIALTDTTREEGKGTDGEDQPSNRR